MSDAVFIVLFIIGWFVLQRWLLPKIGVPT